MIWIIIEFLFPALLIALPLTLYRSNRPLMTKFYLRMTASENARKLYARCMLILILLYHYVYAGGHFGEWGILVSTTLADQTSRGTEDILSDSSTRIGNLCGSTSAHRGSHACLSSSGSHVLSLPERTVEMGG